MALQLLISTPLTFALTKLDPGNAIVSCMTRPRYTSVISLNPQAFKQFVRADLELLPNVEVDFYQLTLPSKSTTSESAFTIRRISVSSFLGNNDYFPMDLLFLLLSLPSYCPPCSGLRTTDSHLFVNIGAVIEELSTFPAIFTGSAFLAEEVFLFLS